MTEQRLPPTPDGTRDHALPRHRVRPPSGWVNDPNGPVRWNGRWHLFFQHNPAAAVHADICWGHASSPDLVLWQDEPVALTPTPGGLDAAGCWSGCVVDDDGAAVAVYTAAASGPETAVIALAHAEDDDLRRWRKSEVPAAVPPPGLSLLGFRDPFVFIHDGRRYAIVGAGAEPGGRGMVLLFACDDLAAWHYLGVLLDTTDAVAATYAPADVWECPSLALLGDRWVLVLSLVSGAHLGRVAYLVGDLAESDGVLRFAPSTGGLVDHGHDFYAPIVLAADDRTLLWGWVVEDRPEEDVLAAGWSGALTVTRELALSAGGELRSRPVDELGSHHGESERVTLDAGSAIALPPGALDLLVQLHAPTLGTVTIGLLDGIDLHLDLVRCEATLRAAPYDKSRRGWETRASFESDGDRHEVRILLDGSVVEIFVAGGPVYTERSYRTDDRRLVLSSSSDIHADVVVRRVAPTDR